MQNICPCACGGHRETPNAEIQAVQAAECVFWETNAGFLQVSYALNHWAVLPASLSYFYYIIRDWLTPLWGRRNEICISRKQGAPSYLATSCQGWAEEQWVNSQPLFWLLLSETSFAHPSLSFFFLSSINYMMIMPWQSIVLQSLMFLHRCCCDIDT